MNVDPEKSPFSQLLPDEKSLQRRQEGVVKVLLGKLPKGMVAEYLLIINKKSNLPRAKRDYIELLFNQFVVRWDLTQNQLDLLKK